MTNSTPANRAAEVSGYSPSAARHAVVDANTLRRSCMVFCLSKQPSNLWANGYSSVVEWSADHGAEYEPKIIIYYVRAGLSLSLLDRDIVLIKEKAPDVYIAFIMDNDDQEVVALGFRRGIKGYIPSTFDFDLFAAALRLILAGGIFIPVDYPVSGRSSNVMLTTEGQRFHGIGKHAVFTRREREIVNGILKRMSNEELAGQLGVTKATIKAHMRNILKKTGARNRTELSYFITKI